MSTSKRIISLLLALVMVLGMLPMDTFDVAAAGLGEVAKEIDIPAKTITVSLSDEPKDNLAEAGVLLSDSTDSGVDLSTLNCDLIIENADHRAYINRMMKYYISSNSTLQTSLINGQSVIFMFEGGSDNYPASTYEDALRDVRNQAVVLVVQKNENDQAEVVTGSGECCSIPGDPQFAIQLDGTYRVKTHNHKEEYGALQIDQEGKAQCLYVNSSNPNGYLKEGEGINIHTRSSNYAGGTKENGGYWYWSEGCQLVGWGTDSTNYYNEFMKHVLGIDYNIWITYSTDIKNYKKLDKTGEYVGCYVIDRQLALDGLTAIYTGAALGKITAASTKARVDAIEISDATYEMTDDALGFTVTFDVTDEAYIQSAHVAVWEQGKTEENAVVFDCTLDNGTASTVVTNDSFPGDVRNFYYKWYVVTNNGDILGRERKEKLVSLYVTHVSDEGTYEVLHDDTPVRNAPYAKNNGEDTEVYTLDKGDRISIVGVYWNGYGNKWYRLGDGNWIYEENVEYKLLYSLYASLYQKFTGKQMYYIDGQVLLDKAQAASISTMSTSAEDGASVILEGTPFADISSFDASSGLTSYSVCNVWFNANGGYNSVSYKSVVTGRRYSTLPVPSRFGYTFNGWFTEQEGGTQITADTICTTTGSQTLYAQWTRTILEEGNCGDNMTYILYGDGELNITGSGEMSSHPWTKSWAKRVVDVIFEGEITSICDSAFMDCTYLADVQLPTCLTKIGNSAFQNCASLTTVDIPDTVTSIGNAAFQNCLYLSVVSMSNSLENLGWRAFSGCTSLTGITIPKTLTYCDDGQGYNDWAPFYNCSSLKNVTIEEGMVTIPGFIFVGCPGLENIIIPDTVTAIGNAAFKDCVNLETVSMSANLESLGWRAFSGCTSLTGIMIPKTLTYCDDGQGYNDWAPFYNCSSLKNVTIEEGMVTIPGFIFVGCPGLEKIVIPDTVTAIGNAAFKDCVNLEAVSMSANLESLGWRAFSGCTSLTGITIPKSLTHCDDGQGNNDWAPFYNCSSLKNVTIERGITTIPHFLFTGCTGIETLDIPNSVTTIEGRSFQACIALNSITIPSTVTSIGNSAFNGCTSLPTVTIPNSVTSMGDNVFYGCTSLTDVTLSNHLTKLGSGAFGNCSALPQITIPKSLTTCSGAIFTGCTSLKTVTLEEGMTAIPANLCYNAVALESFEFPESVTSIGSRAFQNTGLTEIVIPDRVTSTGDHILADSLNLKKVTWTAGTTTVPTYAFAGCKALEEVIFPDTVTTFSKGVFRACDSLETLTLPALLTNISSEAFYDCDVLARIVIPERVMKIDSQAFYNCDSLTRVTIPESVTTIGSSAFYDCDALPEITVPFGISSIGGSAFYDCDLLESVTLGNSLTSLGTHIFYHCDVLKDVYLGRNLKAVPANAFQECPMLEEIVIPYFTTYIADNAFNSSINLKKVVTHEKLASIGTTAFSYPDVTIFYGPIGSYTEIWCADNGYSFVENTAATTKVTAAESSVTIPKGKTYMLDFDIDPIDFHEIMTTKSSNTAVATVDETGKITAVAPGMATIKIIVGGASASCKVTVTQGVTKITLDKTKLSLDVPETYQLTATITPADASNKALNWTSSNPAAATVDANGLVTAVGNGTAVIKAESTDGTGISVSCTVTVIDPSKIPVSSITLDKTALSLEAMETYQLTATISPANAANKALIWTSSNEAVATVDSNGLVTAVAKGTATITATAADGYGASANCTVTVTNNGYVITSLDQFQSSHPYENSCSDFWLYTQPGAGSVSITFDAETEMKDGFDYLYIYDGEGNLIGKYTGTELANQTITIPGDTVKVQIESDDSGNAWGFRVTDIGFTDHTHSFTNYVSDGNATCTEDGTKTAKCDHCDATDTIPDAGSALGHDMGSWETTVPATCTENGEEQRTCSRCDHSESRVIEAVGHRWDKGIVTREPTEDTEGERLYTCTSCGATRTESIPVIGHEHRYEAVVTAPTCTERGYTTYTCKCGESYVADYVAALGHSFGEWVLIQEPTTIEAGLEERSCARCGHTEQRTIAKLENPFSDVVPGSFYYEPVMWAIENGITNGTSATTFGPNDQCMRAHVVTFLWRAVGSPEPTRTDNPFVDVKPGDFYYKPVLWALENGITSGMDATHFGPTAYCNRAQVVTFLYRTMGSPELESSENPFTDVAKGSFYEKPVLWAVQNSITNGLSATTFGPNSICNRAQIVTFLYRAFVKD